MNVSKGIASVSKVLRSSGWLLSLSEADDIFIEPSTNGGILKGYNRGEYPLTGVRWGVGDFEKSQVFGRAYREQGSQKRRKARRETRELKGENRVQHNPEGYVIRKWGSRTIGEFRMLALEMGSVKPAPNREQTAASWRCVRTVCTPKCTRDEGCVIRGNHGFSVA